MEGHREPLFGASEERLALIGGVALVALASIIDITVGAGISLLVVGPLITASVGRPRDVIAVSLLALAVSIPLGFVGGKFETTGHWIAVVAVAVGGAFAYAGARLRTRLRDDQLGVRAELGLERGERIRADLLSRAGELLGSPFEPRQMLTALSELAVPEMADLCVVDLVDPEGGLHLETIAAADSQVAADLRARWVGHELDPDGPHPTAVAARTGFARLMPTLSADDLLTFTTSDEDVEQMTGLGYRSAIVVPLVTAGRTLAVLLLMRKADAPPFVHGDLRAVADLAHRAALALDNRRLFLELSSTERRLDATLSNLAESVTVVDRSGLVYANQAAAARLGFATPAEMLAAPFPQMLRHFVIYGEDGLPFPVDQMPVQRVLAGRPAPPTIIRVVDQDSGHERWRLAKASPVRDEAGEIAFVVSIIEDITDVKRAELSQRFLATATKLLSSSLDDTVVLDKAVWCVVPEVADWCIVHMPDERGVLRQAAFAHRDPARRPLGDELATYVPNDASTIARAWSEEAAVLIAEVPDGPIAGAQDERNSDLLRELGMASLAAVPIRAGERTIGVITFVTQAPRRLEQWHLELVEELGRRVGVALENARVHAARTFIATTLQNSLLPPALPEVPGLQIAARFRAAGGQLTEVGGDFYDMFAAAEGWMIVMGDVTGKGPGAAATTSLARYTLRTAATYEADPAHILSRLNDALVGDEERRQLCTAICAQIVPEAATGRARVRISCAGHPPPYLLRGDEPPRPAGAPGALLGAFEDSIFADQTVDLEAGDVLVLYTDGVTDTRGEFERFGQERLAEALSGLAGTSAEDVAGHLDDTILRFQDGPQRDDVALLVLRCAPSGGNGGGPG